MKLAIFGGTGRTGSHLIDLALEKGYSVNALARNPDKVVQQHENLTVVHGDAGNLDDVIKTITGTDIVISAMGPTSNKGSPQYVSAADHLIAAMNQENISRIILTTGAGVSFPEDEPKFMNKFISFLLKTLSKNVYNDSLSFVGQIVKSDLDWTFVRVPRLTDKELNLDYRTGWVGINMGMTLSRKTLAHVLLEQIEDSTFVKKGPVMSD